MADDQGTTEKVNSITIFHDPVHGAIEMDPVLVAIIDTPQFQRLRDIKQLGLCFWVYPGASHTRFEHCIGTSYLCGKMLTTLIDLHKNYYKDGMDKKITPQDILCVKIAGLCHDIGHGPFSHAFDKFLKGKVTVSYEKYEKHEERSCALVKDVLVNDKVKKTITESGIPEENLDGMIEEIQHMIKGTKGVKGQFLYEIVANDVTGIDCDKFDYIARDTHHVGIKNSFDFERFFKNTKIMEVGDQLRICVRDKEESNLYGLFHTRWTLHRQVYQHKTAMAIEGMILEMFKEDEEVFSKSVEDMDKFTGITDSFIYNKPAVRELLKRIQEREIYKLWGEWNITKLVKISPEKDIKGDLESAIEKSKYNNLTVMKAAFNFGQNNSNPIENVKFFNKYGKPVDELKVTEATSTMPRYFEEIHLRVYCTSQESQTQMKGFAKWFKGYQHTVEATFVDKAIKKTILDE